MSAGPPMLIGAASRRRHNMYQPALPEEGPADNSRMKAFVKDFDRKTQRKRATKELVLYFPFLCLFLVYVLTGRGGERSFLVKAGVKDLFVDEEFPGIKILKTFHDIMTFDEYWEWVQGPLLNGLWATVDYDNTPLKDDERTYIAEYNKLIGSLRMRQARVKTGDCKNVPEFSSKNEFFDNKCYAPYTSSNADHSDIISRIPLNESVAAAMEYRDSEELDGISVWGRSGATFDCSGYVLDIPFSKVQSTAAQELDMLKRSYWLDRRSRAAFSEFYVYNANSNVFLSVKLIVEFTPGGTFLPQTQFRSFLMTVIRNDVDYFVATLHALFVIFVFYYIYKYCRHMWRAHQRKGSCAYFFLSFWNISDTMSLGLFLASFLMRLLWLITPERRYFKISSSEYPRLEHVANFWVLETQLNAFNCVLCFLRVFKFLQLNDRLNLMGRTLRGAVGDLLGFLFIFFIVFFGFSFLGLLAYGSDLSEFRTFWYASATCFFILLGEFNYSEMNEINRVLTPIFFFGYVILVLFVLVNMFLAIINDSYARANAQTKDESLERQLKKKFSAVGRWFKHRGGKKKDDEYDEGEHVSDQEIVQKLEKYIQKNHQRAIRIDDVRSALGPQVRKSDIDRVMRKFHAFDQNQNGELEMEELNAMHDSMSLPPRRSRGTVFGMTPSGSPSAYDNSEKDLRNRIDGMEKKLDRVAAVVERLSSLLSSRQ